MVLRLIQPLKGLDPAHRIRDHQQAAQPSASPSLALHHASDPLYIIPCSLFCPSPVAGAAYFLSHPPPISGSVYGK